ncbi:TetR/AcrR family transcriptional regulator [Spirillospora sp. CA-294931]|uniref:TetR/AcrR family transcriptional regulator n=1 Tax=Spirillospora sp. CA-294931 TaxID=3240042 RepID=UPI003D8BB85B
MPDQRDLADLLWDGREPSSRGPKAAFSRAHVARTAMDLADAEGLQAVSMQRVASELGFTKMALYRYVSGKAELIALMIEEAVGVAPDLDAVPGGWRPRLQELARCLAEAWDLHPWLPWITVGDRIMGPRELAWTERALTALNGLGLDDHERMDAVALVFGHVRNSRSAATAGTQTWTSGTTGAIMREVVAAHADRFPSVAGLPPGAAPDAKGEFGLHRILDGLATLIDQRRRAN